MAAELKFIDAEGALDFIFTLEDPRRLLGHLRALGQDYNRLQGEHAELSMRLDLIKSLVAKWKKDWMDCARGNEMYETKERAAEELEHALNCDVITGEL